MGYMNGHVHEVKSLLTAELTDHIFDAEAEVRLDGVLFCRATDSVLKSEKKNLLLIISYYCFSQRFKRVNLV